MDEQHPFIFKLIYNKDLEGIIKIKPSWWRLFISVPLIIIPFLIEEYGSLTISTYITRCEQHDSNIFNDFDQRNSTLDNCIHPNQNIGSVCNDPLKYKMDPFDPEYVVYTIFLIIYLVAPLYIYGIMIKNGIYQQFNIVKFFYHSVYITTSEGCLLNVKIVFIYLHMLGYCFIKWGIIEWNFARSHAYERCGVIVDVFVEKPEILDLFRPLIVEVITVFLFTKKVYMLRKNPLGSVDVKIMMKHSNIISNIEKISKKDVEKSIRDWGIDKRTCGRCKKIHLGSKYLFKNFNDYVGWCKSEELKDII